ncbi:MAG: hypothetical protein LBL38_00190 [Lactobacillales bacterium]|jgi:hypothetical protein|nr:hypothetical protein [Lactobacillales bacterium]
MNKVIYDFLNENNDIVFSTKVCRKAFGVQFGGTILKYFPNAEKDADKFFFKTHQR